ncbi:MAG: hypothetical protein COS34_05935 [Lysobacterales bacterium CG02_land_8_20_14_3_00_62_12]|nr:MAG: hypothetical protein COS34_05935 [Xanthomonadales bacterium CG02_land_8_20_14_3_00_62_12]PJA42516.1 MAG: hypothetical protein CO182_02030 [Xanthomonadales bacterium CG_4_9_14_3_um_filter_62_6]
MELTIRKFGNSLGITFPTALVKDCGLDVGDAFTVTASADRMVLKKKAPRYTRTELLASVEHRAPIPEVEQVWAHLRPVGSEQW